MQGVTKVADLLGEATQAMRHPRLRFSRSSSRAPRVVKLTITTY